MCFGITSDPGSAARAAAAREGAVRLPFLAVSALAIAGAWTASADGVYTRANLALWAIAVGTWLAAWWTDGPAPAQPRTATAFAAGTWRITAALACVVAAGATLRLHRLSGVPGEPTSDHAEKLLDLQAVAAGEHPIFFPRNTGREPAQFYVTSWLADLLGEAPTFDTLKLGTALVGIAAVPLVFLLAHELFGTRAGLTAGLLFAVSHWPIAVTRTGLRHGYGPLAAALALWLAFRYLRTRDRRDALLCGLALAAGLHGYTAFRIVPLLVVLLVAVAAIVDFARGRRREARRSAGHALLVVATAVVGALPLVRYAVDRPEQVWERVGSRLDGAGDLASTLAGNVWNALLAFHRGGDDGLVTLERHAPFLDPVTGVALVAGIVLLVVIAGRGGDLRAALVLLALPVLLLPSVLSLAFPNENPSAVRLGVAAPLVFAVAGLAVDRLLALVRAGRVVIAAAVAGAVGSALAVTFTSYFGAFDEQYRAFVPNAREVAAAVRPLLQDGTPLDDVYVIGAPYWVDARNIGFELGAPAWYVEHGIPPESPLPAPGAHRLVLVALADDIGRARQIRARYRAVEARAVRSRAAGKDFVLYLVGPRKGPVAEGA